MPFSDLKRKGYNASRTASNGATITLINSNGEFRAEFECATYCAEVLGNRGLTDLGDGIDDVIPCFRIPTEELYPAIEKLTKRFSVALVEFVMTRNGGQFVCLCRLNRVTLPAFPIPAETTHLVSTNLDDY